MNVSLQLALKGIQDEATKPLREKIKMLEEQLAIEPIAVSIKLVDQLLYDVEMLIGEIGDVEYPTNGVYGAIDYNAPFWSEAALYELVGKEAARTLLARHRQVDHLVNVIRSLRSKQ